MKKRFRKFINSIGWEIKRVKPIDVRAKQLFSKYENATMVPFKKFRDNLELCSKHGGGDNGIVVECGVWKGGMSAAIAEVLTNKEYYLFDSFEGLPLATELDGERAIAWQSNVDSPIYLDNCKAAIEEAQTTMNSSKAKYHLIKGWFSETLPSYQFPKEIDILRLDGDWYDSTMQCLTYLFPKVRKGGLIIVDDYHVWDGASKALHDYLSQIKSVSRISQSENGVCFLIKEDNLQHTL